ncbi:hypothetical protein [Verminephrobacter eiseniae]|uniref:Uncharacterized protein n=1 Tax=Verminephrobacter eiseniae (strain EF01-2) TaxID=391735 RepID=A1WHS2_VEREI|nr:hypothetical protein [Verminephrobacter eiseniae]ABM57179.1 hypothetical protein Veis_1418 [Verminephrobacter eiseniae EF01-2]MCW5282806.1 hypothetical protein [Verminephrobacter eiseniae]MCW5303122.1 hypothetical protein [Verminephrobacter eiseniae]MCW8182527.1 hypothetical protein [Verminephrobacter eiseniae]MCW8192631.1 hypothetical protein [Verminephrobacter eiseniae]
MDKQMEIDALRTALRMMGLEPRKVANFIAEGGDYACKAVLFRCVTLDETRLRGVVGEQSNMDGRRSMWAQLLVSASASSPVGNDEQLTYRVWPDGTAQATEDGEPYSWMSDDFIVIHAADEDKARALAGV